MALAIHAAQWALSAHVVTKERVRQMMKEREEKSRIILPGRDGMVQ